MNLGFINLSLVVFLNEKHFKGMIIKLSFSDPDDPFKLTEDTRPLGLVVCRGNSVVLICPEEGMESIANPFVQQDA